MKNQYGIMTSKMVKAPAATMKEIEKHCAEETKKNGQFYSVSKFFRDAATEKLTKIKSKRVDRLG